MRLYALLIISIKFIITPLNVELNFKICLLSLIAAKRLLLIGMSQISQGEIH